ncbi:hypothetical protein ACFY8N_35850 [Streptomyces collinus]|uniref:hypothetical protein n=1 Tax=Streptomyces collinus TaxID=42684 RepID=UPI0036B39FBC
MLDVRDRWPGSVLALTEVPPERIHRYGCAAVEPTGEEDVVRVTGLVEEPAPQNAPNRYALIGRHVLDPDVFIALERTPPGQGGENQPAAAPWEPAAGGTVHGVVFEDLRHDTGDRAGHLRTVSRQACQRPGLGPEFAT